MTDEYFMQMALNEAYIAFEEDEIPIGAVVVQANRIIGRGHNQTERLNDVTAHAEMLALTAAFNFMGSKYLPEATLFVTIEPCHMCAGALYWSKIGKVVFGAADVKQGYKNFFQNKFPFHPKTLVQQGLLASECGALMQDFFRSKR
jgi:tRNA(adenine34) deaminase